MDDHKNINKTDFLFRRLLLTRAIWVDRWVNDDVMRSWHKYKTMMEEMSPLDIIMDRGKGISFEDGNSWKGFYRS